DADARDFRDQAIAEILVPQQPLGAVVEPALLRLPAENGIIQPRAGEVFQILAVGIRAEAQARAVESETFPGIRQDFDAAVALGADESQRAAGMVADERL